MDNKKKLKRSQKDTVFLGVCSGVSEYFKIDPLLIRLPFCLLAFFWNFGYMSLIYFILSICMGNDGE